MKKKAERIATDLAQRLATWDGAEAITLADAADLDADDPYFFLSLDVYYRGTILPEDDRRTLFSDAGAFESSSVATKDRFMIEDVPIRVEFKDADRLDDVLERVEERLYVFRQTGTYMFYRLATGSVLFSRSDWLDSVRNRLHEIPEGFWNRLQESCQATMEHYLFDLRSAVMNDDDFFYLISSAGFIKSFCSLMFVLNHAFEPSGRRLSGKVAELPKLPENFKGRFASILREDPEFTPRRKVEVAELLAKSVVYMQA